MKQINVHDKQKVVVVKLKNKRYFGKGVARCNINEGDKFDIQFGIELASKRARRAYKNSQVVSHLKTAAALRRQATMFEEFATRASQGVMELDNEINSMVESTH